MNPKKISGQMWGFGGILIGLVSLGWLLFRSGTKPSRLAYPCQQAAVTGTRFLFPGVLLVGLHFLAKLIRRFLPHSYRMAWIGGVFLLFVFCGGGALYSSRLTSELLPGPIGKLVVDPSGAEVFAAPTRAKALPSPHRVVAIRRPDTTSWDFPCTSSGVCGSYYGDDVFVDQAAVNHMVAEGLRRLTGTTTVTDAWGVLLPGYVSGQTIVIKLNFNDSIMGGGISGYGDNDAYVDALPQIVNSLVLGLLDFGFAESEIWLFDGSRYITDRFRDGLHYSSLQYFDRYGNGTDVQATTFAEVAEVDFSESGYSGTHYIADPVVLADYLVNIPILKRHGGAGITLALKNHLGSVNGFTSGGHSMHNWFYLGGSSYSHTKNPIVDINADPHIKNKTVLVLGDFLYGAWPDNNEPPRRWASFGNESPNMLFFAVDPVAVDSVMTDFLRREGSFSADANDILIVAAAAGLGVYEHWNNDTDRKYQVIDYEEVDMTAQIFADDFETGDLASWTEPGE